MHLPVIGLTAVTLGVFELALVDTNTFGRVYDQRQWQRAFGITADAVRLVPEVTPGFSSTRPAPSRSSTRPRPTPPDYPSPAG